MFAKLMELPNSALQSQTELFVKDIVPYTFENQRLNSITMRPMSKPPGTPASVHEYAVLVLSIPATTAFPRLTNHYVYLRPNAPKIPTLDTPREVFLVNLPIDATESHIRSLFANQLGGARVEKVEFEGARTGRKLTAPVAPKAGRKRKRATTSEEEVALPETWDREVRRGGSTAVATFVDVASAEVALKEAKRAMKSGKDVLWGHGVEDKLPALGSTSKWNPILRLEYEILTWSRISSTPCPAISLTQHPPTFRRLIHDGIREPGSCTREAASAPTCAR